MTGSLQDRSTALAYTAGWSMVKRLPEPITRAGFDQIARQLLRRDGAAVAQLRANLNQVRPGSGDTYVTPAVHSYLRYWHEAFRLPAWSRERIRDTFILDNVHLLDEAVRTGTGAVMVPGHLANWDHAGAWAALRYGSVVSVAERLKPAKLFDQFLDFRRSLGMNIYGLGEPDLVRSLVREIRAGQVVALLGDRDLGGGGVEVEFCGAQTTLPGGPALLSVLTGAPLYPVGLWFDGDMLRGEIYDRVPIPTGVDRRAQVQRMTQSASHALGAAIAAHPQHWHMMQRVWPTVGPS
jgi:phosphatidylinositol dimannoside acyltransferase